MVNIPFFLYISWLSFPGAIIRTDHDTIAVPVLMFGRSMWFRDVGELVVKAYFENFKVHFSGGDINAYLLTYLAAHEALC